MIEKTVALNELRASNGEQTLENALINVKDGLGPKTTDHILLTKEDDGTYTINDGFHRVAKAILGGGKFIEADVRKYIERS